MVARASQFLVYRKTNKAHDELTERRYRLGMRLRQLLLLIDGSRKLHELVALMHGVAVGPLVEELENQGFIALVTAADALGADSTLTSSAKSIGSAPKTPFAEKTAETESGAQIRLDREVQSIDPVRLARAKAYLIEVSDQHLGLMASKLQNEIALADGDESLRNAIAHWNMALRESRSGLEAADICLQTAWNILGWSQ